MLLKEVMDLSSVKKLQKIIKSRYGLGFEISHMEDSGAFTRDSDSKSISSSNNSNIQDSQSPIFYKNEKGDLRIFISKDEIYLASVVLQNGASLSVNEKENLFNVLSMVLEPVLYNWYLDIQTTQASYFAQGSSCSRFTSQNSLFENKSDSPLDLRFPLFFLSSKNYHLLAKTSYCIHDYLKNWAFVNYTEMKSKLASIEELYSLGRITLMINHFESLSLEEQKIIYDYGRRYKKMDPISAKNNYSNNNNQTNNGNNLFNNSETAEGPFILLTSEKAFSFLFDKMSPLSISSSESSLELEKILPELLHLLVDHNVRVDHLPIDSHLLKECIDLLLTSK